MTTCQRVIVRATQQVIRVQPVGARGPIGPAGGADLNDTFVQSSAATVWNITHALGKFPGVETVDGLGRRIVGEVTWLSISQITVTFSAAVSGKAFLN